MSFVAHPKQTHSEKGYLRNVIQPACLHAKLLQLYLTFCTLWTITHQAPLSMGFPRQEYWSGLPFPSPGNLSDPGIESASVMSPTMAGRFFTTSTTWEAPIQPTYMLMYDRATTLIILTTIHLHFQL